MQLSTGKGWKAICVEPLPPSTTTDIATLKGKHRQRVFTLEDYRQTHGFINPTNFTLEDRDRWCRLAKGKYNRSEFV